MAPDKSLILATIRSKAFTMGGIIKDAGMTPEEFRRLL
jgi:hypothetical protein